MEKNRIFVTLSKLEAAASTLNQLESLIKSNSNAIALMLLCVATIALAFSPIFTKLSEVEISPSATIFNRLWIAAIMLSFGRETSISPELKDDFQLKTEWFSKYKLQILLAIASIAATISALCWAWSLTQTTVASSTVIRSLAPLFVSLGGWLVLKQSFDRQFLWGMILAVVGGITIGWDDLQVSTEYLIGDGIALLSAALHGVNLLLAGYLRDRQLSTNTILLWRCSFGAAVIFPLVFLTETNLLPYSWQGWLIVIALAVICQIFGQGLLVYSLKQFSSSFVALFMLLKPIVTALFAWLIFAEVLSLSNALALVLVLVGIYLAKSSNSAEKVS